ncbi:MAG: DsbA family protein [Persicimonas sp.]
MSKRLHTWKWATVAVSLLFFVGACEYKGGDDGEDEEAEAREAESEDDSDKDNDEEQNDDGDQNGDEERADEGDAPSGDRYPGMGFDQLEPDERQKFVDIAESEVCPCPDAGESLDECLQKPEEACEMARSVAGMIGGAVRQGLSETDILDRVAKQVEAAEEEHDFTLEDSPKKGADDPEVVVVEFADFECPHCKMASQVLTNIAEEYDDEVAVYFKFFPLQPQGNAELAARASVAAHKQDRFWQMHDLIFENQRSLSRDKLMQFARRIGLNVDKFKEDMEGEEAKSLVQRDKAEGQKAEITGTPAVFIDGQRHTGAVSQQALVSAIEAKLEGDESDGEGEKEEEAEAEKDEESDDEEG